MQDDKDKREGQTAVPAKKPHRNPREDRLKQALRENLKRRKSQARGRSDPAIAPSNGDQASPYGGSGKEPSR
jgi:hypothetical protein